MAGRVDKGGACSRTARRRGTEVFPCGNFLDIQRRRRGGAVREVVENDKGCMLRRSSSGLVRASQLSSLTESTLVSGAELLR